MVLFPGITWIVSNDANKVVVGKPVTICFGRRPANPVILKTEIPHRIRVEQISSVKHDRGMHPTMYLGQVNSGKIGPLGC